MRRRGYGISDRVTERGVAAIGACVRGPDGQPVAAVAISAPCLRMQRRHFPRAAEALRRPQRQKRRHQPRDLARRPRRLRVPQCHEPSGYAHAVSPLAEPVGASEPLSFDDPVNLP
ncbi:IclR family transcriptional regulator C-terminal domain-containing protein [Streptomyces chartreusis]|uniref:IclR family transcriptional regulator domain-containing protein n=1 Tax=Streptomyces chartreusis TaxID=1969 RepID=UPI002F9139DB|nr:IclR family transcriptional regulator C-terminal domain-containing protein [Streptomyces chartreusis]WTA33754.1 IclR family transcriptional regulator C-terminal domain-containing protein [Streptomyces chartreusis]